MSKLYSIKYSSSLQKPKVVDTLKLGDENRRFMFSYWLQEEIFISPTFWIKLYIATKPYLLQIGWFRKNCRHWLAENPELVITGERYSQKVIGWRIDFWIFLRVLEEIRRFTIRKLHLFHVPARWQLDRIRWNSPRRAAEIQRFDAT